MLIMHMILFCRHMKIVVAMVTEIVKMLQKHTDPEKTKKTIQASLMKLSM